MTESLQTLARALADAWNDVTTAPLPPQADAPSSRADAYIVQDRMAELIVDSPAGWKVGATVPAVQRLEGHDGPIPGRLFASRLFEQPARVPARLFPGANVECEFAFRANRDLPYGEMPFTASGIVDAIDLRLAVELTGSRFTADTGGRQPGSFDTIADNGNGAGFVFGPAIRNWQGIAFETLAITPRIDNGPAIKAYQGEYRRDPVAVMAETLNDLAARGFVLSSGDYLSTGSLTEPTPIRQGQTLMADFASIGTMQVELV